MRPLTDLRRLSFLAIPWLPFVSLVAGCARPKEADWPTSPVEPVAHAPMQARHARPVSPEPKGGDEFPESEVSAKAPVSALFSSALATLRDKYPTLQAYRSAPDGERMPVLRLAVAAFQPILVITKAQVLSAHPEAAVVEGVLSDQLSQHKYKCEWSAAALFSLSAALDHAIAAGKVERYQDLLLAVASFVSSEESVYRAMFESAAAAWPVYHGVATWTAHPFVAVLSPLVLPAKSTPKKVRGVTVHASGGFARISLDSAVDGNGLFQGDGQVEPGEIVRAAVGFKAIDTSVRLFSESILVSEVPDCAVVLPKEVVVPEMAIGATVSVPLPTIFFSSRCSNHEVVRFKAVSSSFGNDASFSLDFDLHRPNLSIDPPVIDADVPGSSVQANAKLGIVPGQPIELRLSGASGSPTRWTLGAVKAAVAADAAVVVVADEPAFRLSPRGSKLVATNDVDLKPVGQKAFSAAWKGRSKDIPLASDPASMWFSMVATGFDRATPHAAPAAAAPYESPAGEGPAEKGKHKKGGKHRPVVSLNASAESGPSATRFYEEFGPLDVAEGVEIAAIASTSLAPIREIIATTMTTAKYIDADLEQLAVHVTNLAQLNVYSGDALTRLVAAADKARMEKTPASRRLMRHILLIEAVASSKGGVGIASNLNAENIDPEHPINSIARAVARAAIVARYSVDPDANGLDAFADVCAAASGAENTDELTPVTVHRFVRVAVSDDGVDESNE